MKALRWMAVPVLALSAVACGSDSGGGSTEAWCDIAKGIEDKFDSIGDAFGGTPDEIKALFEDLDSELAEAVDAAPSEIADQVKLTQEGIGEMKAALEDADYNILDVDLGGLETIMTNEDMSTASDEIEAFNEKECGIVPEDTTATDDTLGAVDGTAREEIAKQLVAIGLTEEEASCVAENVDPAMAADVQADPSALMGVFETCGIGVERLAEIGQSSGG